MTKSVFSEAYETFRSILVCERERRSLTQVQLAQKLKRPQSFVSKYERGERRLDVVEFIDVSAALGINPARVIEQLSPSLRRDIGITPPREILARWRVSPEELTDLVDGNPSLRGILLGYIAEMKLEGILSSDPRVKVLPKPDDHDRKKKGDRLVEYRGQMFIVEVKSLQTNSIRKEDGKWIGKAQVDASDRRKVELPGARPVVTTCLRVGDFDLLAVNLFAFQEEWRFVYAKNGDLPRTAYRKYTKKQRQRLLATTVTVTWPPEPPFYDDPFLLLDEVLRERTR